MNQDGFESRYQKLRDMVVSDAVDTAQGLAVREFAAECETQYYAANKDTNIVKAEIRKHAFNQDGKRITATEANALVASDSEIHRLEKHSLLLREQFVKAKSLVIEYEFKQQLHLGQAGK